MKKDFSLGEFSVLIFETAIQRTPTVVTPAMGGTEMMMRRQISGSMFRTKACTDLDECQPHAKMD
jgi:hypothetical protein